jgi:hypothetical protein
MQQPRKRKGQVGVPRRFSIGTLMILVTAFAVLFSLLKVLHAPPVAFAVISIFVAVVAACQVLLFKGKNPRKASFVAGAVMYGGALIVAILVTHWNDQNHFWFIANLVLGAILGPGAGGMLGYAVGCLVAAIFLIRKEPDDELPETSGIETKSETGKDAPTRIAGILPAECGRDGRAPGEYEEQ